MAVRSDEDEPYYAVNGWVARGDEPLFQTKIPENAEGVADDFNALLVRVGQLTAERDAARSERAEVSNILWKHIGELHDDIRALKSALQRVRALLALWDHIGPLTQSGRAAREDLRAALGEPTGWQCAACGWTAQDAEMGAALWPHQEGPHNIVDLICPNCHAEGNFVDHSPAAAPPVGDETPLPTCSHGKTEAHWYPIPRRVVADPSRAWCRGPVGAAYVAGPVGDVTPQPAEAVERMCHWKQGLGDARQQDHAAFHFGFTYPYDAMAAVLRGQPDPRNSPVGDVQPRQTAAAEEQ